MKSSNSSPKKKKKKNKENKEYTKEDWIHTKKLHKHPENIRIFPDVKSVRESIKRDGIDENMPLKVEPHPDKPGNFRIFSGFTRYKAIVQLGKPKAPCVIYYNYPPGKIQRMARRDNQSKPHTLYEKIIGDSTAINDRIQRKEIPYEEAIEEQKKISNMFAGERYRIYQNLWKKTLLLTMKVKHRKEEYPHLEKNYYPKRDRKYPQKKDQLTMHRANILAEELPKSDVSEKRQVKTAIKFFHHSNKNCKRIAKRLAQNPNTAIEKLYRDVIQPKKRKSYSHIKIKNTRLFRNWIKEWEKKPAKIVERALCHLYKKYHHQAPTKKEIVVMS